jgi:hypothetical protein
MKPFIPREWLQIVKRFEHSTGRQRVIRLENVVDDPQEGHTDKSTGTGPCHQLDRLLGMISHLNCSHVHL